MDPKSQYFIDSQFGMKPLPSIFLCSLSIILFSSYHNIIKPRRETTPFISIKPYRGNKTKEKGRGNIKQDKATKRDRIKGSALSISISLYLVRVYLSIFQQTRNTLLTKS